MSLARGIYGIEYDPHGDADDGGGLGKAVVVVVLVALTTLSVSLIRRSRSRAPAPAPEPAASAPAAPAAAPKTPLPPAPPPLAVPAVERRPVKVRNLLLRLEEADRRNDLELAVSTIEQIRALPGQPAADIDDRLARRLGKLNEQWLFSLHNAQWVATVTVRAGDSASRLAREHGSTVASMIRLNGWTNADRLITGQKIRVMNHPRFNLVVHRRTRTADLQLNGKFFMRFDCTAAVAAAPGAYETPKRLRAFLAEKSIGFSAPDLTLLEDLLPAGTPVLVSDL